MYNTTHHLNFRSEYMNRPVLGIPQNTIEILRKYDFSFQKKFGQNFLIDTHVLDKIIQAAKIDKEDMVLEIGPGIGTMTQYLAEAAGKVLSEDAALKSEKYRTLREKIDLEFLRRVDNTLVL